MIFKIALLALMFGAVIYGMVAAVKNNNVETPSEDKESSNLTR